MNLMLIWESKIEVHGKKQKMAESYGDLDSIRRVHME